MRTLIETTFVIFCLGAGLEWALYLTWNYAVVPLFDSADYIPHAFAWICVLTTGLVWVLKQLKEGYKG